MNILILGVCLLLACFGVFAALLGSSKPRLFGALFSILVGSSLALFVCKTIGLSFTSIPVFIAMGAASLVLLVLSVWKESIALFVISLCGGLYIGGGLVYSVSFLFSLELDWFILCLAAGVVALIFTALCLVRPGTGILVATSVSGSSLVSICASAVLYSLMTITASAGFIGDLLSLYNALSAQSILLTWLLGLLLSGGAMLLQSLLLRSVEDVEEEDSWENWSLNDEGNDYKEEPKPVVKRGSRRKKKKSIVEPYDWGEQEEDELSEDSFGEDPYDQPQKPVAQPPKDDYEQDDDFEETLRTSAPLAHETHSETTMDSNTKVFRKVVLPKASATPAAEQKPAEPAEKAVQPAAEQKPAEPAEKAVQPAAEEPAVSQPSEKPAGRLTRPTFPPRSQSRK